MVINIYFIVSYMSFLLEMKFLYVHFDYVISSKMVEKFMIQC